ncbi:MAG: hypothetical protein NVS3B28_21350 [Candidatus Velthaea sp.]
MRLSFALAAILVLLLARAPSVWAAPQSGPQVGATAPPFRLKTITGATLTNDTYRGRTLVINVWATWCPPCRAETPDLIASATKLRKEGVAFLGVDTTEDSPTVRAFVADHNVPYAQAIDSDKSFTNAYNVVLFPTTYVIDPKGVLRAHYVDVVGTAQLASFVRDAELGRNGQISSPLQTMIDAVLSDPTIVFTNDGPSVETNAKNAVAAISRAEDLLNHSTAATPNATDFVRTRAEERDLRDRAIAALVSVGTAVSDTTLLPGLRGDAARDEGHWNEALQAYGIVLAIDPKNSGALAGVAMAGRRLSQFGAVVDADRRLAALNATDVFALINLGNAQADDGQTGDAFATFARAEALARDQLAWSFDDPSTIHMLAYAHLYAGRVHARAGDVKNARAEFDGLLRRAKQLPRTDTNRDMFLEEGQEGIVALGLRTPNNGASISIAPWTGPDLPGSLPSTTKYRLVVAGAAGHSVDLRAIQVPNGWIASFCSDRACAPFKRTIVLPISGVKIVEFQLVPPNAGARVPKVRVAAKDGAHESSATT